MKFLQCADLHLGINKYGYLDSTTGLNSRVLNDLKIFNQIVEFAIKKKVKIFVITGDVFDDKKPNELVRYNFIRIIKKLLNEGIKVFIISGNHEGTKSIDEKTCLHSEMVMNSENFIVINKAKICNLENGIRLIFFPYSVDKVEIDKMANEIPSIVFGHFTVSGGVGENGYEFKEGEKGVVNKEWLNNKYIKYVGLGHLHTHQILNKNIVYSGSIYQISFADSGQQKGFIYGDIDEETHFADWKFIEIPKGRKFITINSDSEKWIEETSKYYLDKNVILKINIKDNKNKKISIDGIMSDLTNKGYIIESVNLIKNKEERILRNKEFKHSSNPVDVLQKYLKEQNQSEYVITLGTNILKESGK